jgi:4-amino-4-deoxy-L-arabinose transferase-like glycosyltransferase
MRCRGISLVESYLESSKERFSLRHITLLILLGIVILFCGNNVLPLTNPDEVFYAETAKEMAQHATWTTPYIFDQPQFEKPVLTYDFIRVGFLLFGDSPFGARFFPAVFGLLGVLAVYLMARWACQDEKKAFLSAVILMTSALYFGLSRTAFTDMLFTVFILLTLLAFYAAYERPAWKTSGLILFHVFAALAVLTKGPLGYLLPILIIVIFLLIRRKIDFLFSRAFGVGAIIFLVLALPWYLLMINRYGGGFIQEFFYNDHWRRLIEAEHSKNDKWYFYPASMLGCMFPWICLVAVSLWGAGKAWTQKKASAFQQFLLIWIVVVFVTFQVAHSKLVSYIFPLFPAMALLAADDFVDRVNRGCRSVFTMTVITWACCAFIPVVFLIAAVKYPMYVPSKSLFLIILGVEFVFVCVTGLFVFQKKTWLSVGSFAIQLPLVFFLVLMAHESIGPYVSTQPAVKYLMQGHDVQGKIICSKFFARGVKYFSGKEVVLMNINSPNFFSPHPILDLNTDEKLAGFLRSQSVTYGILNNHAWEDLKRICPSNGFNVELLKRVGDEHVVKVTSK